ncbi:MAG: hypothetical protein NTY15_11250 [Planctomycetota bacterium]|jgi:hypothetical protein|nr:hypothetical protein [Planctomycetota bacterium]
MKLVTQFIDPDIFTVSDVFFAAECDALIERAEAIGFDAASVRTHSGPKMMTNIRNNDRMFKRHKDGSATNEAGYVTKLTYLLYLNDGFEGGETTFREYTGLGDSRREGEAPAEPFTHQARQEPRL